MFCYPTKYINIIRNIEKRITGKTQIERSRFELEKNKKNMAGEKGREMGSTSEESSCNKETPTT